MMGVLTQISNFLYELSTVWRLGFFGGGLVIILVVVYFLRRALKREIKRAEEPNEGR